MNIKCPKCHSHDFIVKYGIRKNRSGSKQKYRCNKCRQFFVEMDAFFKRKYSKEIIAEACSCYKRGMSFNEAANHINEYKGTKIVPATIFFWMRDYSKILKKMG